MELDVPAEPTRIVASGLINPDSIVAVHLSLNKSLAESSLLFEDVAGPRITLFEDGREVAQLYNYSHDWFTAPFQPQVGHQYTIQVTAEGLPTVESDQLLRDC